MNQKHSPTKVDLTSFNEFVNKKFAKSLKNLYIFLGVLTTVIVGFALYFGLQPFSFYSAAFRFFLVLICVIWSIPLLFKYMLLHKEGNSKKTFKDVKIYYHLPAMLGALLIAIFLLFAFISSPLVMAKNYRELISINENADFATEIEDYTQMKIPVVDKALAMKLGDKKLGEDNYGSQYTINDYTMIEYKDDLYWVGAIEHDGFFKWLSNASTGGPGYALICATNTDMKVDIIKKSMTYQPAAYFTQDLERNLYFKNMGLVRDGRINLELDEDGTPYYTQAVIKNSFLLTSGRNSYGLLVLNAVTGHVDYYDIGSEPEWIDRVIPTEIANEQINYWGTYKYGFFNTLFAKKEVLNITEGYNYIHHNGSLCLYTGLTSVGSDESVVGIVLCNLKNKQTDYFRTGGATEYAAQQSALGKRQEMSYTATFPCLINYGGEPTYFMSLKDNEGLIKLYAYVNLADYTNVSVADTIKQAQTDYNTLINIKIELEKLTVSEIKMITIDGTSIFYIKFAEKGNVVYQANVKLNINLPFVKSGDKIDVRISENVISEMVIE